MLALAVWSSAFTAVAIATGFERRYGVLERLAATPLGKPGLLAGKAGAVLMIMVGQLLILTVVALRVGLAPAFTPASAVTAVGVVILAAAHVRQPGPAAGRPAAGGDRAGGGQPGLLIMLVGGALVIRVDRYPAALQPILMTLPTAALGEGLRAAAAGPGAGLAVAGRSWCGWPCPRPLAVKGFRWM